MRTYHHLGIPTKEAKEGETYHANLKFSSTPFGANEFRIQWHRFDDDCEFNEIVKTIPHVAFKVDDLEAEIQDKIVVFGPYSPIKGFRAAMIITDDGFPIEFIETDLTDEKLIALEGKEALNINNINIK
ncbi:MAG: hypothetical protein H0T62_07495 [Parachlamydiaceae bacterium]|nr:hypothetical protein [Parachlamydiaceae bacterium]